jgi:hypothetical protein
MKKIFFPTLGGETRRQSCLSGGNEPSKTKEEVDRFIMESGGRSPDSEKVRQATYEDMHEMMR